MSVQARQALRLMKFIAEMKKNNYPNASRFAKLLREMDVNENMDCACSPRTVLRDIEILQTEYHAPIAYDAGRRGYYLKNHDWEFSVPIMGDELLSMTLLGTRLASDLLPEPIKTDVTTAVEKALTGNSSEFFDEAMIESLLCATGIKAAVDPAIFKDIFEGWRRHQVLALTYRGTGAQIRASHHRISSRNLVYQGIRVWHGEGQDLCDSEDNLGRIRC